MSGDANLAILFYRGSPPVADAIEATMDGDGYHLVTFTELTNGERNVMRDVLYAALESIGYSMVLPPLVFEQERDDPNTYHVVSGGA